MKASTFQWVVIILLAFTFIVVVATNVKRDKKSDGSSEIKAFGMPIVKMKAPANSTAKI